MCTRDYIDQKNHDKTRKYINQYPDLLNGYYYSMSRKTSYTKSCYIRYVYNFLEYLPQIMPGHFSIEEMLHEIKPMHIDMYMEHIRYTENGKEKSGMYRAAQLAAIRGFFSFLKRNQMINNNPCDVVEVPRDVNEHDIITMSNNDVKQMLYNIQNGIGTYVSGVTQRKWHKRDELILILGITTGLRVSALIGIDIEDIDLRNKYIKVVEKGRIEKKVYIGQETTKAIKEWLKDREKIMHNNTGALFICNGNKRMSVRTMENIIKNISGGKFTPHKMRATCATRLYEATGDIYRVQQQLGHKSINNTQRYAKVSETKKKESANILDSMFKE